MKYDYRDALMINVEHHDNFDHRRGGESYLQMIKYNRITLYK